MSLLSDRIDPLQFEKAAEVPVRRVQLAVVFDGQCGEMGIRNEVPHGVGTAEQSLKNWPMFLSRLNDSDAGLSQPALHALDRFIDGQRTAVQPRVGGDADKGRENGPA